MRHPSNAGRVGRAATLRRLLAAALALVCLGVAFAARPKHPDPQARAKARHYFALATQAGLDNRTDMAYEYAKRAYKADPTYSEGAYMLAGLRLTGRLDTLNTPAELRRTLKLASQYVDEYPQDFDEGMLYAYMAVSMDTVPEALRIYQRLDTLYPARHEVLLQLSDAYARLNRIPESIRTLSRFEEVEGATPQTGMRKVAMYLSVRDTVGALAETDSMVARHSDDPLFRILRGNVYDYLDDSIAALDNYLAAERLAPQSSAPKLALAQYYSTHGEPELFDSKTYQALLCEDLELEQKLQMGAEYISSVISEEGEGEEEAQLSKQRAETLLNSLRAQYPHEPQVLELVGSYHRYRQEWPQAEEALQYAIDLAPTETKYWDQLLSIYMAESKYKEIAEAYKRAENLLADDRFALMMTGLALEELGRYDEGFELLSGTVAQMLPGMDPETPITDTRLRDVVGEQTAAELSGMLVMLGDLRHRQGLRDQSYVLYENALLFNPSNAGAYNNYAYFLAIEDGDLDKAAKLSRESIAIDSDNPTYIDTYAWILYKTGDLEGALDHQLQALELAEAQHAMSAEYYDHLGDIYFSLGRTDEAVESWKKALEMTPDDKTIQNKVRQKRIK